MSLQPILSAEVLQQVLENRVKDLYLLTSEIIGEEYLTKLPYQFYIKNFSNMMVVRPLENQIIILDPEITLTGKLLKEVYEEKTKEKWFMFVNNLG